MLFFTLCFFYKLNKLWTVYLNMLIEVLHSHLEAFLDTLRRQVRDRLLSNFKNILLFSLKVLCPQNIPRPDEHHGRREDLCGVVLPGGVPSGFFPTRSWSGTGIQRSGNAKLFTRILKLISFQTESYKYLWEKITRFNCWHYSTVIIQQTCASGMTTEIAEWMACSKSTDL